ncbi:defensin-1-like [Ptiloglossa arizonensis]|uniref:defensin-1-like n=1 Tax=Ptiloglossa arizonensis TaxID=3350558 RepID=UPI003F9F40BB
MKFFALFAFLLVAVAAVMAAPKEVAQEGEFQPLEVVPPQDNSVEERGATCGLVRGDYACAIHCVMLGKPGGHCKAGTCVCY